ncbi:MAG: hypothetical protein ACRDGN_05450, partial [bacterium]
MTNSSRLLKLTVMLGALLVLLLGGVAIVRPATAAPKPGHGHGTAAESQAQATPEQRAAAGRLYEEVKAGIARFADVRVAEAEGFERSGVFRFGEWGPAHFRHRANRRDDRVLDATRPEGLVYFRS